MRQRITWLLSVSSLITLNRTHLYHRNIVCIYVICLCKLPTLIKTSYASLIYLLAAIRHRENSGRILIKPGKYSIRENIHWKTQLLIYFEQKNDLVKLALDENLREHDRVISPAGVTGALEISGKTPLMLHLYTCL